MARVSDEYALKLLDQITGPLKRIEQQASKVAQTMERLEALVEARRYFEKAADIGHVKGMTQLAVMYRAGAGGLGKNPGLARKWLENAAAKKYAEAMYQLGWMARNGEGMPANEGLAKSWFEKAAALGHAGAKNMTSQMR